MALRSSRAELQALQPRWGWLCALGAALVVFGIVAIAAPWMTTLASVAIYGWLLLVGGICEVVAAFSARPCSGVLLHLAAGILGIVVGVALIGRPDAGATAATLVLAIFLTISGLSRSIAAGIMQFPAWGWAVAGGLITTLLGASVWSQWPSSSTWLIGTFVGVELLSRGWSLVMFALAARSLTSA